MAPIDNKTLKENAYQISLQTLSSNFYLLQNMTAPQQIFYIQKNQGHHNKGNIRYSIGVCVVPQT